MDGKEVKTSEARNCHNKINTCPQNYKEGIDIVHPQIQPDPQGLSLLVE